MGPLKLRGKINGSGSYLPAGRLYDTAVLLIKDEGDKDHVVCDLLDRPRERLLH
jgi:hypothetical protein